ncbi:MAG: C-terminal target protein [Segetibacter sp.]|nr:C-terminal target protein [Segetibacter sp.]
MVIFTKKTLGLKFSFLLFLFSFITLLSKAQFATDIYTDFGGFWHSSQTAFNPILPNKSHNVVGFIYSGTTYSTGVKDSLLTNRGIPFTPGRYKTLPFTSLAGTVPSKNNAIYIALAEQVDGVASGFSNPLPSVKAKDVLTDGINGLNIGTGVTNLPSSAGMIFPAQIINNSAITDDQPDIIYAQLTESANSADVMVFQDSVGHTVGKSNSIQWNLVKSIGSQYIDFYNLRTGAAIDTASITSGLTSKTTENLRLATFKLADFGITIANASEVKAFVIKPAGSSDPAFIAYNTEAIYIIPPIINLQPKNQIVCAGSGGSATFSIDASGLLLTYQWYKNGVSIPGATNASYTVPVVTASDEGAYQVVVTNPGGKQYSAVAYLNASINQQPSPAAQTIVTGNTVTYAISANNATSFQWKKNGIDIPGAIDSIYTISPLNVTDGGIYTVAVLNSAGNGCANMLSDPVTLTPVIVVYSKSTPDINIPSTWGANPDGSGSTPVDFTRAEHTFVLSNRPYGNTLTDLTIAGTLDVKDGTAIIADSTTLDVGWCIRTGTGSLSGSSTSGFTVRGNSNLYFTPGSQLLKNFTVMGGTVNMLSDLTISGGDFPGKLNLTGGTLALGSNKITIQSTSTTNTSMVTTVGPAASITYGNGGAFIVERFIPAKRSYRFISPAATTTSSIKTNWMEGVTNPDRWTNYNPLPGYGTHITGPRTPADSLDVTQTYNPSLFTFDKTKQTWNAIPNSAGTLTAGRAFRFMIRGSRAVDLNNNEAVPSNTIIRTTGSLTIGTYTVDTSVLSTTVGAYSFVGNPYASPVDWRYIPRSGISSSYYSWDETLNKRGAYVSYNAAAETNSSTTSLIDENIQSSQAFLVQSTSTTPSIQFQEINKTQNNRSVFREANTQTKLSVQLLLNLNEGAGNAADGFVAVYGDNFLKEIGDEDAYKFNNLDENIAINRNGTPLSIEGRPSITDNDTLPVKMWQFRQKNYWLKIDGQNFSPSVKGILKDEYLKKDSAIDLASSTIIPFTITSDSASFASNRFSIIFKNTAPPPAAYTEVKAYHKDKGIQVEWNTGSERDIDKYEVEKSVNNKKFNTVYSVAAQSDNALAHSYQWFDDKASSSLNNYYRIKITEKTGNIRYSSVVRVTTDGNREITSSAVDIKENTSLQSSNIEEGRYAINIYNNAGQKVYSGSVQYSGDKSLQTLLLKRKMASGWYIIQLTNDKTRITKSILVQ